MRQAEAPSSRMEASWHRILQREEQRATARHVAAVNTAWFAWDDPSGRVQTEDAILLDISRGGASAQVDRFAPYRSLWLCIEANGKVWGVRFETIEESANSLTGNRLRGRFPEGCSEEFYRVALRGHREKTPEPARPQSPGGLLDWLKSRIGRRSRPAVGPVPDASILRERAVRRLAGGAVEVVLTEPADEPSADCRFVAAPA